MTDATEPGGWHLDKRVPIALIVTLVLQTAGAVWWISGIVHRLDAATETNVKQDVRLTAAETTINGAAVSSATTTAQLHALAEDVTELKTGQVETNRLLRDLARGQP